MTQERYDDIIIGGGFYGCFLALHLAEKGRSVLLLEKENELLQRASKNNQARVHGGYHYSRHFLTALRSRVNLPRFMSDFKNCIVDDFDMYYAIATQFSKTTAAQFSYYMSRAGAPLEKAPSQISRLFSNNMVTDVFKVKEPAFDARKLKEQMEKSLEAAGITFALGAAADRVIPGQPLTVEWRHGAFVRQTQAARVYNCTYSDINRFLKQSGLETLPLRYELTELCKVEVPDELKKIAITLMCGPFFSVMPFPMEGCHTLSHVRYTPHASWRDGTEMPGEEWRRQPPASHFAHMVRDGARYLPLLHDSRHLGSIWEVKTLLVHSDKNDSRPILYKKMEQAPGLVCIMGGKIDNIYDIFNALD